MIKIKSPIYLSFKSPLACLDGGLKSGVSVANLILIMGLKRQKKLGSQNFLIVFPENYKRKSV